MSRGPSRRAFALVEVGVISAGVTVAVCALAVLGHRQPAGKPDAGAPRQPAGGAEDAAARAAAMQTKDGAQVSDIFKALHTWSQQNREEFPLPLVVDKADKTIDGGGASKDCTANIFSILIYAGLIKPETCVSPAEANPAIKVMADYQFSAPKAAAHPEGALWDPAFAADLTPGKKSNVSYAHAEPWGARGSRWGVTFATTDAVLGNRGPEIELIERDEARNLVPRLTAAGAKSYTLLIHGKPDAWEGHVAWNDGHAGFEGALLPKVAAGSGNWPTYVRDKERVLDCLHFDEPDDMSKANQFMGVFVPAPENRRPIRAVWD